MFVVNTVHLNKVHLRDENWVLQGELFSSKYPP